MNAINKVQVNTSFSPKNIPAVSRHNDVAKRQNEQSRKDSLSISYQKSQYEERNITVEKELEAMLKNFPDINIYLHRENITDPLKKIAENLGFGTHLIISENWLEQALREENGLDKGLDMLRKVLTSLAANAGKHSVSGAFINKNGITFWTGEPANQSDTPSIPHNNNQSLLDHIKKGDMNTKPSWDSRIKHKVTSYTVAGLYSRLAGAGSKQQVRTAISEVHRNIGSLQLESALGDSKERSKARAAISSLRKLLLRGNRKIQRLSVEEITVLREKRARKQAEQERALALRIELKKQRCKRRTADSSLDKEGHLEDLNNAYRFQNQDEHRYKKYHEYMPPAVPSSVLPSLVSGAASSVSGGAAAIQLSPTISFEDV